LSLMGPQENVKALIEGVQTKVSAQEIPDPSNSLFINRRLSVDFDYDRLSKEKMDLYKLYSVG
jgi:hypothetical protein